MATALHVLGQETWGERLARARARRKLTLQQVAERVSQVTPIHFSTIGRLEGLGQPPPDLKRRLVAFCVLVACGYDPADFGLGPDDLPAAIDADRVVSLLADPAQSSPCITAEERDALRRVFGTRTAA